VQSYTGEKSSKMGAGCRFLTYIRARETSSSLGRRRRPLHSEPAPLRCGPARRSHLTSSSRHEPPRAARRRELSQAGATAASAAPSSPRILHQGRISARMMADLINSISSCARPSQHARGAPAKTRSARARGGARAARAGGGRGRASSFLSRVRLIDLISHQCVHTQTCVHTQHRTAGTVLYK
jgi:hypothetical protein